MTDFISVLVVDDSAFMRKVISDIINSDPSLRVIGTARNGREALQKIALQRPDVVTLDIEMPEMDGLTTLQTIMAADPLPVVMLSNLTQLGAQATIKALHWGAVDFIAKPSGPISLDIAQIGAEIIKKIKIAAVACVNPLPKPADHACVSTSPATIIAKNWAAVPPSPKKLVLIGASTGGPKALNQIISSLPADLEAAVLVAQHMPPGFTQSLAERLDKYSQVKVKEAENGEPILAGHVYIAPGDYHMRIYRQKLPLGDRMVIKLSQDPQQASHRPSINELFYSAAEQFSGAVTAVILTGMGNDGTAALQRLHTPGNKIIAEHQSSCVVYGMPKTAIESGCVDAIFPLPEIAAAILAALQ